jgi:hypothetical protein
MGAVASDGRATAAEAGRRRHPRDDRRLRDGQRPVPLLERATQALTSHHLRVAGGRLERVSVPFRYVWPAELDLMAQLAGMRLRERWGKLADARV